MKSKCRNLVIKARFGRRNHGSCYETECWFNTTNAKRAFKLCGFADPKNVYVSRTRGGFLLFI